MCGICGWAGVDPKAEFDLALLKRMTRAMEHRGPDGEGYFEEPGAALGHRRLSILDIERGAQPFFSPSKRYAVTYNGEIYNAPELREELLKQGFPFDTHCDTEVITVLAERDGFDFVDLLEGIFGFGLWDRQEKRLLLARDGLGVKPLIYRIDPDGIRFASEAKALYAEPGLKWDIDPQALHHYLSLNSIPAPHTIHSQARKLEPGQTLVWQSGAATLATYWSPPEDPARAARPEYGPVAQDIASTVGASVRGQLQSDVPLGVFLSAGVDSAVILQCAHEHAGDSVSGFCLGFEESSYDERSGARQSAEIIGSSLTEYVSRPRVYENLPQIAAHYDEPFGDASAVNVWELCRQASKAVKVALSGEGGDEVFGGYETYRAHGMALALHRTRLAGLAGAGYALARLFPASDEKVTALYKATRFLRDVRAPIADRHFLWKAILEEDSKRALYSSHWAGEHRALEPTVEIWRRAFERFKAHPPISRAMLADMTVYLPNDLLTKVDIASMAHGLEVRTPLLDRRVVERMAAAPDADKADIWRTKKSFKAAFETGPARPIFRRAKKGFSMPVAKWIKSELKDLFFDAISSQEFRNFGALRREEVEKFYKMHEQGKEDQSRMLWGVLMLALWLRQRP